MGSFWGFGPFEVPGHLTLRLIGYVAKTLRVVTVTRCVTLFVEERLENG